MMVNKEMTTGKVARYLVVSATLLIDKMNTKTVCVSGGENNGMRARSTE